MRSPLRAPFVVTVGSTVAAAVLGACGNAGPTHTMNPPGIEPTVTPPPPDRPMNPPEPVALAVCPPAAPADGTACLGELSCHYGSTDPCAGDYADHRCVSGTFVTSPRPTCNPPPPPSSLAPRAGS